MSMHRNHARSSAAETAEVETSAARPAMSERAPDLETREVEPSEAELADAATRPLPRSKTPRPWRAPWRGTSATCRASP